MLAWKSVSDETFGVDIKKIDEKFPFPVPYFKNELIYFLLFWYVVWVHQDFHIALCFVDFVTIKA